MYTNIWYWWRKYTITSNVCVRPRPLAQQKGPGWAVVYESGNHTDTLHDSISLLRLTRLCRCYSAGGADTCRQTDRQTDIPTIHNTYTRTRTCRCRGTHTHTHTHTHTGRGVALPGLGADCRGCGTILVAGLASAHRNTDCYRQKPTCPAGSPPVSTTKNALLSTPTYIYRYRYVDIDMCVCVHEYIVYIHTSCMHAYIHICVCLCISISIFM